MKRLLLAFVILHSAFNIPAHAQTEAVLQKKTDGTLLRNVATGAHTLTLSATGTLHWTSGATLGGSASAFRTAAGLAIGSDVQAYSANLTTFAGIAPSANVQSLLGAADYSAMRSQLGLVIGTNVQAYDAELAAIASLANASGVLTNNGSGTLSWTGVTSVGSASTSANLVPVFAEGGVLHAGQLAANSAGLTNPSVAVAPSEISFNQAAFFGSITSASLTANRSWVLPDASGTLITTGNLSAITGVGTITSGTWQGSDIALDYIAQGGATDGQVIRWNDTSGTWEPGTISTGITIGSTAITGGTSGRILYDNAGVVGELTTTGSGDVVRATAPTLVGDVTISNSGTPTFSSSLAKTILRNNDASSRVLDLTSIYGTAYFDVAGGGTLFINSGANVNIAGQVSGAEPGNSSNFTRIGWDSGICVVRTSSHSLWLVSGTNAQRFLSTNTYTSATNFEAAVIDWQTSANTLRIGSDVGSGGGTARDVDFVRGGVVKASLESGGFQVGTRGSAMSAIATVVKAAHDCGSIAAGATETTTATITDCADGSTYIATPQEHEGLVIKAAKTSSNTVTITFRNLTSGSIDASAVDVRVTEIAF